MFCMCQMTGSQYLPSQYSCDSSGVCCQCTWRRVLVAWIIRLSEDSIGYQDSDH
jgi:hypothetical protein